MVLAVVLGLHALFGVALVIGTAAKFIAKKMDYIVAVDIKPEDKQEVKEPPPPPPDFKPPPVAPPPTTDVPVIRGPPSETALAAPKVQAPPPPKVEEKHEPPPIVAAQYTKNGRQMLADACADRYPSASRRLSEEGLTVLQVYVTPDGRASDAKVETSSGFPRLDEAAVSCVKSAGKAFQPVMVGNTAQAGWARVPYRWKLN